MKLVRMFSNDNYKGQRNYLDSQKCYEILRVFQQKVNTISQKEI